jgi:hypothetical protein
MLLMHDLIIHLGDIGQSDFGLESKARANNPVA